jgi:hypothetical protein
VQSIHYAPTKRISDGSLPSAPYDPEATQHTPSAHITNPPPTGVLPSTQSSSQQIQRSSNHLLIIVILLALIVCGGVVALIKFGNKEAATTASSATPTLLTIDGVRNLISRWVSAQNSKNLTDYQSCYGVPFEGGIRRTTSGRSYSFDNFNDWMKDRLPMISVADDLNVEVKNMNVNITGDTAIVEFDQYYRSQSYSDWGPKVMKVKMTPAGEKIVYEELKVSYPLS